MEFFVSTICLCAHPKCIKRSLWPVGHQPEYMPYVLSGGCGDVPFEIFGYFTKPPRQTERFVFISATFCAASLTCLSSTSSCCIESWDSDKVLSCWRTVTTSQSESSLILLSFSISSAFRYIRIFRSSTKLSWIFKDFAQAVYSIERKSYKYQANQLVERIIYGKD